MRTVGLAVFAIVLLSPPATSVDAQGNSLSFFITGVTQSCATGLVPAAVWVRATNARGVGYNQSSFWR